MSLPSTAAWASPSVMALTSWPSIGWRTWGADGADVNETSTRRQRDVNETSNDIHGEWLWMALNRDSWWADGLGCNENVEFISVMILAENLMNDWNHLILSCLNSLNFSFFGSGVLSTSHKSSLPEGYNGPKMQMLYEVYWSMIMFSQKGNLSVYTSQPWKRLVAFFWLSSRQKNLWYSARMQVQPLSHRGELEGIFEVPSSGSAATGVADSGVNSHGCPNSPVSAF